MKETLRDHLQNTSNPNRLLYGAADLQALEGGPSAKLPQHEGVAVLLSTPCARRQAEPCALTLETAN